MRRRSGRKLWRLRSLSWTCCVRYASATRASRRTSGRYCSIQQPQVVSLLVLCRLVGSCGTLALYTIHCCESQTAIKEPIVIFVRVPKFNLVVCEFLYKQGCRETQWRLITQT